MSTSTSNLHSLATLLFFFFFWAITISVSFLLTHKQLSQTLLLQPLMSQYWLVPFMLPFFFIFFFFCRFYFYRKRKTFRFLIGLHSPTLSLFSNQSRFRENHKTGLDAYENYVTNPIYK